MARSSNMDEQRRPGLRELLSRRLRLPSLVSPLWDEPAFETARTRLGRLDRMRFDDEGLEIVVTRIPMQIGKERGVDLFTGRPIRTVSLDELRQVLASDH